MKLDWRQKRVLVTGAGGFIGSHLVEHLVAAGAEVRAMVHYRGNGDRGWLEHSECRQDCEIVAGDVACREQVREFMRGCDIVFHLAALIAIPYSYQNPEAYLHTNIEGTLNMLLCARDLGVERLIHTSTSEAYGTARYVPIDEEHPLQAQSPYSASKIAADKLAESFYLSFGLPVVTVRPFNTYGPRQSTRAVLPVIICQCLAGGRVRLGSLEPRRDFNFVGDTVRGFRLAAEAPPEAIGQTVNLGSGRDISIGEAAALIGRLVGITPEIECDEQRLRPVASEVDRLLAANERAREIIGWQPEVTLEDGLARTVAWFRENRHLYRVDEYAT